MSLHTFVPGAVLTAEQLNDNFSGVAQASTLTATGTLTPRLLADRAADVLHARDFGVVANGTTDDSAALAAWWTALQSTRRIGVLPPGVIRCLSPVNWNMTPSNGVTVHGASNGATVIDVRAAPASLDGGTQFLLSRTAGSAFYGQFVGFSILGNNTTGPAARFGRVSLADEFNGMIFRDMEVKNIANAAGAIALELNGHYNCDFQALTTNTGGTRVAGTSLRIRRASFCRFFGSFSGAGAGILVDGTFSFGNAFVAINVEETDVGVRFAGSSNNFNNFVGGTFVANTCLDFQAGSGAGNTMLSPNFGPYSGGVITAGTTGLTVIGNEAAPVGNVVGGGLQVARPAGRSAHVILDSDPAHTSALDLLRNNSIRWRIYREAPEPGGNAGSTLFFEAFSDTGTSLGTAASMERGTAGGPRFKADRALIGADLQLPSYTVASLPPASPASRVIFVSNESGGAVLAFSDGTNWRRVTDRAIVS